MIIALLRLCCCCLLAALIAGSGATAAQPQQPPAALPAIWSGVRWGETASALVAQFGARATVLPQPIDFGDSYANVVLRNVSLGGVPVIAFFQMDKRTGGLKRIQIERQRHGVNPPAARAILAAIEGAYGAPDAACSIGAADPANGYQAAAEWRWRRRGVAIHAIFRDTTIEAFEGCLGGDITSGPCGLTGQFLVRITPSDAAGAATCLPVPPAAPMTIRAKPVP
jgi:hypothetical protein